MPTITVALQSAHSYEVKILFFDCCDYLPLVAYLRSVRPCFLLPWSSIPI